MIPDRKVAQVNLVSNEAEDDRSFEDKIDYLEWLMIWYCKKPSAFLANVIVTNLETLKERNTDGELSNSEWSCNRLLKNWEYIAERCRHRA